MISQAPVPYQPH